MSEIERYRLAASRQQTNSWSNRMIGRSPIAASGLNNELFDLASVNLKFLWLTLTGPTTSSIVAYSQQILSAALFRLVRNVKVTRSLTRLYGRGFLASDHRIHILDSKHRLTNRRSTFVQLWPLSPPLHSAEISNPC